METSREFFMFSGQPGRHSLYLSPERATQPK
jgi:hypothetical protein